MNGVTVSFHRIFLLPAVLLGALWLSGCADNKAPLMATVTVLKDGSHFSGNVVRREGNSITITGPSGETHTFLYTELSDIKYGAPDAPKTVFSDNSSAPSPTAATSAGASGAAAPLPQENVVELPEGTEMPVRTEGLLDSCCMPLNTISIGVMDDSVKNAKGVVVIPEGASVTFVLTQLASVNGRITMQFELGSADFGNHHYIVSSSKGGLAPGAVVTFTGPKDGSEEAKARGTSVHIDTNTDMIFKAASPVVFKLSS